MKNKDKYNKSIAKLAKLFKTRENPKWLGAITGEVIVAPPNLEVKIQNGVVIKNKHIMIGIEKTVGYTREYKLEGEMEQEMKVNSSDITFWKPHNHKHDLKGFTASGTYKATGKITWTDTLKVGDTVLMLPTNDHEYFYLIDKVVRL